MAWPRIQPAAPVRSDRAVCKRAAVTIEVIGAGFGRTGTLSLKTALEQLGFPCHHMMEVFANPTQAPAFTAAARGDTSRLPDALAPYRATVDWPSCVFWRELLALNPDAKVLLSVRPSDRWWNSFSQTIHAVMTQGGPPDGVEVPPPFGDVLEMASEVVRTRSFGPDFESLTPDQIVAAYEAHNQDVRDNAPADRFLEFDVVQGWEPLCTFLGVDVPPGEPFPNVNDTAEFRAMFGLPPL
jgi:hypothetical protein